MALSQRFQPPLDRLHHFRQTPQRSRRARRPYSKRGMTALGAVTVKIVHPQRIAERRHTVLRQPQALQL